MHYLIDGHNLIAQMPDIKLDDPNDEAKLVLRLRSWAAASRKRQVTIIFDHGLPGGQWRYMSRGPVQAVFASAGQTADALLMDRARQVSNPAAYTMVTGDREILSVAKARRMPYIASQAFAQKLQETVDRQTINQTRAIPADEEPVVSEEEVSEWLALFDEVPESQNAPAPDAEKSPGTKESKQVSGNTPAQPGGSNKEPASLKSGSHELSADEVDEWLSLFQDSD